MSQVNANSIYDASGGQSAKLYGVSMRNGGTAYVNRIINGAMVIDQRNAGAAVTISAPSFVYTLDRWFGYGQLTDGVFTVQRSTTAPTGFTNSALTTVTTADASIGASQLYGFGQKIEGFNVADLGWGTASAQSVTLSFQVRTSVTGTYSVTVFNSAFNRGYTATFTVSAANTFETKTITIPGDTSGTWATDNSIGLTVWISLGAGSTFTGTAGAWNAGTTYAATGQVNLIATSGATFYITGVQLEAGSVASPFERRDYGRELQMCQRYFQQLPSNRTDAGFMVLSSPVLGGSDRIPLPVLPVPLRTSPTVVSFRSNGTTTGETTEFSSNTNRVVTSIPNVDACGGGYLQSSTSFSNPARLNLTYSAEL